MRTSSKNAVTVEITEQLFELFQKFEKLDKKQRDAVFAVIDSYLKQDGG